MEDNLFQLHDELKDRTYQHGDYTSFCVTDPKLRHIHKATVRDRVLHQAVFRVLYPIFDKTFINDSYSCRINKGTHRAVNRLEAFCCKLSQNHARTILALKCDIKKFFDSVDQGVLLNLIRKEVRYDKAMSLVEKITGSFEKAPNKGLPLGNVTSQLFASIYLNELDWFVKYELKEKYYIRYCDDFVILNENQKHLSGLSEKINNFLTNELNLSLHPDKIIIRKYRQGLDFLGYVVLPHHRVLRTRTKRRLLKRINEKNQASYLGILDHCDGFRIRRVIEEKIYKP